jgi:methylmalonyl-CoA/ethylmalonyl-CoA epimerase
MTTIRFDHIAIAMPRMADAPAVLVGALGGVPAWGSPSGVFRWGVWTFKGGGAIEILEPTGDDGFLHRFLERGPGVHHVTFKVPSLDEVCARAQEEGYDVVGRDDSDPSWKEAFLHPKQALGIVVQFAQAHGEDGPQDRPPGWPPPGPPDPPPPVTIRGLRLTAHTRERARRQWEGVLEGEVTEGPGGELVYRWPDSPMRLIVEIDPARDEGPVAIELTGDRAVALPDGPHPLLGTVL